MTTYKCRDCGHTYGAMPPTLPLVQLHRVVTHSQNG